MQSESLREIGQWLCTFRDDQEIHAFFNEISNYAWQSSSILLELKHLHEIHFYPSNISKKSSTANSELRYLCNVLTSISSISNSLMVDSRKVLDFIDDHSDDITYQAACQKLLDMEKDIASLSKYIKKSSDYLLKQNRTCTHDEDKVQVMPTITENNVTRAPVGFSDFSLIGPDEVFLGSVEGLSTKKFFNDNEYVEEFLKPSYYDILMEELKATLISKHQDFEEREIKSLKSNDDIETYKSCNSEYNITNISDNNEIISKSVCTSCSEVKDNKCTSNFSITSSNVAIEAQGLLKTWGIKTSEECFGDETSNEDD